MESVNPFNVIWPVASGPEVTGILITFALAAVVFAVIRYVKMQEQKKINDNQLFLFQVKRKGLSNFQIKILNNMVSYLRLSSPTTLVKDPSLFASSINGFCESPSFKNEDREHMESMCRDMAIMYERLYVQTDNRKPLKQMGDIETDQVLYFSTEAGEVYLGKVTGKTGDSITVKVFRNTKDLNGLAADMPVTLYLPRVNDAEYSAKTVILGIDNGTVILALTDQFVMEREFRHPYINVLVPVTIIKEKKTELEADEQFEGTIFRLNEYEAVIRISGQLPYEIIYNMLFEIMDYKFNTYAKIISSRTVETEKVYYYTMKFENISGAARAVLRQFINDHM